MIRLIAILLAFSPMSAAAQPAALPAPAASQPVTIESYYRIKWGSAEEFERLYDRNHAPLLRELQKAGYIVAMKVDRPFTHMAGGARWDLRVTITYRDSTAAMDMDPAAQALWAASKARRFSLLEEHWDVVIN